MPALTQSSVGICHRSFLLRRERLLTACMPIILSFWARNFMSPLFGISYVWRRGIYLASSCSVKSSDAQFPVRCYSKSRKLTQQSIKEQNPLPKVLEEASFYVARKDDMVGIFWTFDDCQSQIHSVMDPAVSVYKASSLTKETEEYLACKGLKNPSYVISAKYVKEDTFGVLIPCLFQHPEELSTSKMVSAEKELQLDQDRNEHSCILEFDGASKGNPGKAGAGVILRTEDRNMVWRLQEGLGITTCNAAEYHALILGLKHALSRGFKNITVQCDSKLVCMQMQGLWKTKSPGIIDLFKKAMLLKSQFHGFAISHVKREHNSEADAQANKAVKLGEGEIKDD